MKVERWQRIQEIFDAATEQPQGGRREFVARESNGDSELERDVLAMLSADESAGGFIETAVRSATTSFVSEKDPTRDFEKFGKYEIVGWIGEGGFSQVHKGRDPDLQREVAIKTCTSASRDLRKRFYREAKISAGLQHPNIVTVHDLGVENGVPFLVQELLSGDDLGSRLAGGHLDPSTAVDALVQVARGLEYAHRKGVLHRDIKPSNIQALNSGRVKILDFGIARFLGDEDNPLTDQGTPIGTAGYQSPEQLEGAELDRRTDIFSFGVLAYEMLAGSRPFPGRSFAEVYHNVLQRHPTPLRKIVRECPPALESLILSCLEKDRVKRPKNFTVVIGVLEEVAKTLPPSANPGSHLGTLDVTRSRRWRRYLAAGVVLTLVGASAWIVNLHLGSEVRSSGRDDRAAAPGSADTSAVPEIERHPDATPPGGDAALPASPVARTRAAPDRVPSRSAGASSEDEASPLPPDATTTAAARGVEQLPEALRSDSTAPPTPISPRGDATPVPELAPPAPESGDRRSLEVDADPPFSPEETTRPRADSLHWEETAPAVGAHATAPPEPTSQPVPRSASREMRAPALLEPLELEYPERTAISLKERRQLEREDSVRVILQVLVDESGNVRQASVRKSSEPGTAYQDAALAVVKQARFKPGTVDGEPVQMWTLLSLEYKLR